MTWITALLAAAGVAGVAAVSLLVTFGVDALAERRKRRKEHHD